MGTGRVVIVNGASSAGKSSIIAAFRGPELDVGRYWHSVGIDDVFDRLPWQFVDIGWPIGPGPFSDRGLAIGTERGHPRLRVGSVLRALLRGYQGGVAAFSDQQVDVIVDEVVLDSTQLDDWRSTLGDRPVEWIALRCDEDELDRREKARGDRPVGLARAQVPYVHEQVSYSLELDSTRTDPETNAQILRAFLNQRA